VNGVVLAHTAGTLGGLPIPRWQFAAGVAAVVVLTFFVAGATWRRPKLAALADGRDLGRVVARVLGVVLAVVGLVAYVVIVTAGLFGTEFPAANIAPIAVFITFWVGVQFVAFLLGDPWPALSPFATLALAGAWLRSKVRRAPLSAPEPPAEASHWPAAIAVTGFVWLELAYHAPTSPRVLGLLALAYGVVMLAMAAWKGRGWLRRGDGFAVLFSLLGAMAPFHAVDGHLRLRWPLAGLATLRVRDGTLPVLFVVLGGAVFDGLNRTTFWFDLTLERVGWGYTAINTLGLLWTTGIVALVYLVTTRVVAKVVGRDPDEVARAYAPVLVPVVAAYTVAHYFAVLVLEGQGIWGQLSDPYGRGEDLFGTADATVDFNLVSVGTIAWVQAAGIALGCAGAVLVAHDRAISDHKPRQAVLAQYPFLVMLVGAAVAAVALTLGN
jgi:hypothetical protein